MKSMVDIPQQQMMLDTGLTGTQTFALWISIAAGIIAIIGGMVGFLKYMKKKNKERQETDLPWDDPDSDV